MNSYFEKLFGQKTDTGKHRAFSDTEIPSLVDRLIDGIEGEESAERFLEETLTGESNETFKMKMSKEDFGNMLLTFEILINHRKKLAEIKMTLDGLISFYKEAHERFDGADNEATGLQEVKKMFGWRHREPVNRERIFWEYIELIMGTTNLLKTENPPPMGKKDAIEFLRQRYDFESYDSTYKQIQRGLEGWKQAFGDKGYKYLLPENSLEIKE